MKYVLAALLAVTALLSASCSSLPPQVIPRHTLFMKYDRSHPRLSPDGSKLAYLAIVDDRPILMVRTLGKKNDHEISTSRLANQRGLSGFFWHPDSRHILFWQDTKGDENFHLAQIDIETDEALDLTPFENTKAGDLETEVDIPGKLLVTANARNKEIFDLYEIDTKTGVVSLRAVNPGRVSYWLIDHHLEPRGAIVYHGEKQSDDILLYENGKWGKVTGLPELGDFGYLGMAADNETIWVRSTWKSDRVRLLEINLKTKAVKVIADDPEYDVGGAIISHDSRRIEAVFVERDKGTYTQISDALKPHMDLLREKFGGDSFSISNWDHQGKHWIVSHVNDVTPLEYYLYEPGSKHLELLFTQQPGLSKYKFAPMRPIAFKARDKQLIHGYLTLPVGAEPEGGFPMIVFVHGGPQDRDVWGFDDQVQWLASRGYAVLQVNFRGSSGYGARFHKLIYREWGRKSLYDIVDGKNWAISQGHINKDKVCIFGYSFGGYTTMAALAFTPDEFKCGVAVSGISDLKKWITEIPPYWRIWSEAKYLEIGNPDTDSDFMKERSPLYSADKIKAPLLLVHAANDPRVPQNQSDLMFRELKRLGKPVTYLAMKNGGHSLSNWRFHSFTAAAEEFFGRYLGGYVEPVADWDDKWDDLIQ